MPQERPYPEKSYSDKSYAAIVSYLNAPRWSNVEMMFPQKMPSMKDPEFVVNDPVPSGEKPE